MSKLPENTLDVIDYYTHIQDLDNNQIDNYGLLKDILSELDLDESESDSVLNFARENGYKTGELKINDELVDYLIIAENTDEDQISKDFEDFYVDDEVIVEFDDDSFSDNYVTESLEEAVGKNYIYHGTSLDNAKSILKDNVIHKSGNYMFNLVVDKCVCLSRDYEFVRRLGGVQVVFVLDRDKLTQNYKLEPITDKKNDINPNSKFGRNQGTSKAEEICFRNIENLKRYIAKVILYEFDKDIIELLKLKKIPYVKISKDKNAKGTVNEAFSLSGKVHDLVKECEEILYDINPDWDVRHPSVSRDVNYLNDFPLLYETSDRNTPNRLGCAYYPKNGITRISFNSRLGQLSDEEVKSTILHELAHIIAYGEDFSNGSVAYDWDREVTVRVGSGAKLSHHGPIWQRIIAKISQATGIELSRLANSEEWNEIVKDDYKYKFKCPECGAKLKYARQTDFTKTYDKLNSRGEPIWWCTRCRQRTGKKIQFVKDEG